MAQTPQQFGGEYGFINKRLPVWKIQFANDATRWYVETASGELALRADAALPAGFLALGIGQPARRVEALHVNDDRLRPL